ncbi:hypothetical protein CCH79_00018579, partial [Gambusia affinis]
PGHESLIQTDPGSVQCLLKLLVARCCSSLLPPSGLLAVSDLQSVQTIRQFRYVGLAKNWSDAQTYCRERFSDLAAILNAANGTEARQAAGTSQVWIGLFNGSWKWSQDENRLPPSSSGSMFTMWSSNEPQDRKCTLLSKSGYWSAKDCGDLNEFLCYHGSSGNDVLVKQKMSWFDAQAYCRETYTDLTSIRDVIKNYKMTTLLPDSTFNLFNIRPPAVAWIGLHRSDWAWSDGSSASYWPWAAQTTTEQTDCVTMDSSSGSWSQRSCSDSFSFLCSAGEFPRRLCRIPACRADRAFLRFSADVVLSATRALKIRLQAGSADLNDPAVQESILQQVSASQTAPKLREKMEEQKVAEEVKLSWRIQPDGKIFHRQQEETAPPACEAETCH